MSHMILKPKFGSWILYPSDRPSQREVFDIEPEARRFAAKHYKGPAPRWEASFQSSINNNFSS